MTGYQSKKLVTDRHADPVTVDHIIQLRKENERLQNLNTQLSKEWYQAKKDYRELVEKVRRYMKDDK
jgi:hypothetical protein